MKIESIPFGISWVKTPLSWKIEDGNFTIVGGKGSRLYVDPRQWEINLKIGFLSQSPRGDICETVFSEINYENKKLEDIRNGK